MVNKPKMQRDDQTVSASHPTRNDAKAAKAAAGYGRTGAHAGTGADGTRARANATAATRRVTSGTNVKSVVVSSGHGSLVRGASGYLDEVDEARRIVDLVAEKLRGRDVIVETFHDDTSTSQNQNLETIVKFHNSKSRQLDISVHLNAYVTTSSPMGTECLYKSQSTLSAQMSAAMAEAGRFINRGPKKRTDLYFLNQTAMPAILLEICFVDSLADAELYDEHFEEICDAITMVIHPQATKPRS